MSNEQKQNQKQAPLPQSIMAALLDVKVRGTAVVRRNGRLVTNGKVEGQ